MSNQIYADLCHLSLSSAPNVLSQEQALKEELADIEAEYAAYQDDLATYQANNTEYEAMSAKLDAGWNELEAKGDDIVRRRRKLEADSVEYDIMRAKLSTKGDEQIARAEELAATSADLELRRTSHARRREIARQTQIRINALKNADHGIQTLAHPQANIERSAQPSLTSQQGTSQFQQTRAEVGDVNANPGEPLQQLGLASIRPTE